MAPDQSVHCAVYSHDSHAEPPDLQSQEQRRERDSQEVVQLSPVFSLHVIEMQIWLVISKLCALVSPALPMIVERYLK